MGPRVYVAHPMTSYGTDHERVCLAALAGLLPGVELFDPSRRYQTDAAWLRAWPRVLDTLCIYRPGGAFGSHRERFGRGVRAIRPWSQMFQDG